MTPNDLGLAVSLLVVLPVAMTAQVAREHDPVSLKHWPAPLYWQPTKAAAEEPAFASAADTTNLLLDTNALVFVAMMPCRVVDTRVSQGFSGAFGPPDLAERASRTFPVPSNGTCAIPTLAQAYSFNIAVVPPGPLAFITVYPTGQPVPLASTLNSLQGLIVANAAIVPAGTNGSIDVYASNPTDIVIDINGYYAPLGSLPLGAMPGNFNTALGLGALASNAVGIGNTAAGYHALQSNTTGGANTALGEAALSYNTTGGDNTAIGDKALESNTSGGDNTACGAGALYDNTTGSFNTASGGDALLENTTGSANTAFGTLALAQNTTGSNNTAIGYRASGSQIGPGNTTGNNNIAIGYFAAVKVLGENSDNIHIGNQGSASDNATVRIGTPGTQSSFFVAGVRGVTTGNNDAIPVVIDSAGQLGTVSSSRRFKEDIQDMGAFSGDLIRLRPVTFRYKEPFVDGSKPIQYGLIAEEVAEVYPDLVARSADGQIETVKYQVLDSMLLNELQKEHQQVQQQAETIRLLGIRLAALEGLLSSKTPPPAAVGQ